MLKHDFIRLTKPSAARYRSKSLAARYPRFDQARLFESPRCPPTMDLPAAPPPAPDMIWPNPFLAWDRFFLIALFLEKDGKQSGGPTHPLRLANQFPNVSFPGWPSKKVQTRDGSKPRRNPWETPGFHPIVERFALSWHPSSMPFSPEPKDGPWLPILRFRLSPRPLMGKGQCFECAQQPKNNSRPAWYTASSDRIFTCRASMKKKIR